MAVAIDGTSTHLMNADVYVMISLENERLWYHLIRKTLSTLSSVIYDTHGNKCYYILAQCCSELKQY